jgi:hypothetical protein
VTVRPRPATHTIITHTEHTPQQTLCPTHSVRLDLTAMTKVTMAAHHQGWAHRCVCMPPCMPPRQLSSLPHFLSASVAHTRKCTHKCSHTLCLLDTLRLFPTPASCRARVVSSAPTQWPREAHLAVLGQASHWMHVRESLPAWKWRNADSLDTHACTFSWAFARTGTRAASPDGEIYSTGQHDCADSVGCRRSEYSCKQHWRRCEGQELPRGHQEVWRVEEVCGRTQRHDRVGQWRRRKGRCSRYSQPS